MRRFTDPILFGVLFVLDVLAWLILSVTGGIEAADPGRIAPMNVGTVIVIATQALALATVVGLVRAVLKIRPRQFYMWALALAVVNAVICGVAALPAQAQHIEVGMSWAVWSNSIAAFVFLVALIIAITGGIPSEPRTSRNDSAVSPAPPTSATAQKHMASQVSSTDKSAAKAGGHDMLKAPASTTQPHTAPSAGGASIPRQQSGEPTSTSPTPDTSRN